MPAGSLGQKILTHSRQVDHCTAVVDVIKPCGGNLDLPKIMKSKKVCSDV